MSEAFVFRSFSRDQAMKKKKFQLNKILWTIIIVLLIILIIEIIFQFVLVPNIKIENIIIESDLNLSKDEILDLAGMKKSEYYFALKTEEVEKKLEKFPPVAKAQVDKIFPNTLKVKIWVRQALGCYIFKQDARHIPLLFDENGMVFKIGEGEKDWDFPVISGIPSEEIRIGKTLPDNLMNLLADLYGIRESNSALFSIISEVEIVPVSLRDFELALYLIPYRTGLRLGGRINSSDIKYALMLLDIVSRQGIDSSEYEIDLRTQQVVYRSKEGEAQ